MKDSGLLVLGAVTAVTIAASCWYLVLRKNAKSNLNGNGDEGLNTPSSSTSTGGSDIEKPEKKKNTKKEASSSGSLLSNMSGNVTKGGKSRNYDPSATAAANGAGKKKKLASDETSDDDMDPVKLARQMAKDATAAYKKHNYEQAVEGYSKALRMCLPTERKPLLCNRAAAHVKLRHFDFAVEDCDAALALEPLCHKTLNRRGNAKQLGGDETKLASALNDLVAGWMLHSNQTQSNIPPPDGFEELNQRVGQIQAKHELTVRAPLKTLPTPSFLTSYFSSFCSSPGACAELRTAENQTVDQITKSLAALGVGGEREFVEAAVDAGLEAAVEVAAFGSGAGAGAGAEAEEAGGERSGAGKVTGSGPGGLLLRRALLYFDSKQYAAAQQDISLACRLVTPTLTPTPPEEGANTEGAAAAATTSPTYPAFTPDQLPSPVWGELCNFQGTFLHLTGEPELAKEALLAARAALPTCGNTLVKLAGLEFDGGRWEQALKYFGEAEAMAEALREQEVSLDVFFHRGQMKLMRDDPRGGGEELRKGVALRPESPPARAVLTLAVALYRSGDQTAANEQFARAAELDPTLPDVQSFWGETLAAEGQVEEALYKFGKALELDPAHTGALVNKAMLVHRSAPEDDAEAMAAAGVEAKRLLGVLLEADSTCVQAYVALAQLATGGGELDTALEMYGEGLKWCRTEVEMAEICSFRAAAEAQRGAMQLMAGPEGRSRPTTA